MEQPEPLDSASAIVTTGLTKRFGRVTAVDHLDLVVNRGSIFGLVGPDGAGKTTTLRMLCGAMAPTEGTASVAGFDVVRQTELARLQLGYMPQSFSLYPDLSVQENLEFFADVYEVPRALRQGRMDKLLEFSRLTDFRGRRAEHLSGGMKKKLALACTLIHEPRVLLLDEPTTGVDPVSRRELWHILYDLLRSGVTTVVTTPYMDEAERCNRVGFLMAGRLLVSGTPSELADLPRRMVIELKARPRKVMQMVARGVEGVDNIQIFGDRLHLLAANPASVMAELQGALDREGAQILTLRIVRPSMEDVFMHLAQQGESTTPQPLTEAGIQQDGHA
jgi:ABC-2 type transport system ATP-binding protein